MRTAGESESIQMTGKVGVFEQDRHLRKPGGLAACC